MLEGGWQPVADRIDAWVRQNERWPAADPGYRWRAKAG
jgi:hypothetical protein